MRARDPYEIGGGVALVTGAGSGIGAALAQRLASQGSDLALVDRNGHGLAAVAETVATEAPNITISTHVVDLSHPKASEALLDDVVGAHGRVTALVNNAGIALAGHFEQVSMDQVDAVLNINLRATMAVTSATLPHLRAGSQIVNISSLFGIIAPIGNAVYAASKFGVRGFSLALRAELAPRAIGVTTVFPGGIRTAIARNALRGSAVTDAEWTTGMAMFDKFLVIEPDVAANMIVNGLARRAPRVLIGPETYVADVVARIAPASATGIFAQLMRLKARI